MKSNELMVGDWVRGTATLDQDWYGWQIAPGECIQVRSILHTGINYESNGCAESFEDDTIRFDDIEPIPLTPEILEKNGWDPITYKIEGAEKVHCRPMVVAKDYVVFEVSCGWGAYPVVFVHQLQHLLRLFEIDKEIEL